MLKIFKNKRKLKYIILSILIIIVLLGTITLTIVNNLSKNDSNSVQIAKANETYSSTNPYIPKGFEHSEGNIDIGYVIKETATGNEFVWIPVDTSNTLARREFTKTFSSISITPTLASDPQDSSFIASVNKYGGYYVGRYEAGVGSTSGNNVGVPVCKKGATVWRNISRNNAASSAQEMYKKNEELTSSLMNSYAYDTMLNWLRSKNYNVDNDSSSWGNYNNSSDGTIKSAGTSNKKANNIYDIAGNVWEWTTENYGNDAVVRGGDALSSGIVLPAGTRDHALPTSAFDYTGFRVLLYRDANFVDKPTALAIAAGLVHTAYLDNNGTLRLWGKNTSGEIGIGNTTSPVITPTSVNTTIKFKEIALTKLQSASGATSNGTTSGYTIALSKEGYLYGWGNNAYGRIGDTYIGSTNQKISTPKKISNTTFEKIAAGVDHCLAIDTSGNIWAWGSNSSYKTGVSGKSTSTKIGTPTQITSGIEFKEISAGYTHNMALDKDGNLYTWGSGTYKKLCNTSTSSVKTPTKVNTGNTRFTKIAAGHNHSLAIDTNHILWGAGNNQYGELGNGSTSASNTAIQFTSDITKKGGIYKDISTAAFTNIAIDTGDHLLGWGLNTHGQLGNGSTTQSLTPIPILSGIQIKKVSAGELHFIAIANNEDVYTCGYNNYGQLGNSSTDEKLSPIKIYIPNTPN